MFRSRHSNILRLRKIFAGAISCLGFLFFLAGGALGAADAPAAQANDIILQGKLSCALKRNVPALFKGVVTKVNVTAGQLVKEGQVLAQYRLAPEVVLQTRKRLSPPQIADLEVSLNDVQKNIASLAAREKETRELLQQNMASRQELKQIEQDMAILRERQVTLQERIRQERQFAKDDLQVLKQQMGKTVGPGNVPEEVALVAPIGGYVIAVHPDVREKAEINPGMVAFTIAMMDPMLMKVNVHEIEATKLKVGDTAELKVESLADRKFEAKLTRLSWTPVTPGLDQPSYYEVELTVTNSDMVLKDGLKGVVTFHQTR